MKMIRLISVAVSGVLLWAAAVVAQEPASQPSGDDAVKSVKADQEYVRQQFIRLTEAMIKAADTLEKSDPESAKALREAVDHAKRKAIDQNMSDVIADLEKGLVGMATGKVGQEADELKRMIDLINSGAPVDPKQLDKMKQISQELGKMIDTQTDLAKANDKNTEQARKEIQDLAQRLGDVINQQKELLKQTSQMQAGDPTARKLAELKKKVDDLVDKQEKLRKATDENFIDKLALEGQQQDNLSKDAKQVADTLKEASTDPKAGDKDALSKAGDSTSKAGESMKKAADDLTKTDPNEAVKNQDKALADLKDAQKALGDALAKASEKTPGGQMSKKQDDLRKQTEQLAKDLQAAAQKMGEQASSANLDKAAGEMAKASENLAGQKPSSAAENQKEAIKNLENLKKDELAKLERVASMPKDEQARKQDQLAKQAQDIAKQMQQPSESKPDGMSGSKSMSKGAQSAQKASQKMSKSGGQQQDQQDANQDQKDAADQMQKAKEELDDEIAKAQQDQQDKALAKINELLQKMLDAQKNVSTSTKDVDAKKAADGKFQRIDELTLAGLSQQEGTIADDAKKVVGMLTEEGSTAVFPEILKQVEGDLRDVQSMLGQKQPGPLAQAVQGQVEQNLQEMIDALKKERSERQAKKKGGGGGGGGGGKKPPLVPPLAELKMLKTNQLQINARTRVLNGEVAANRIAKDESETQHKKLAENQNKVEKLTLDLKAKLGQQQQQPPAPAN